MVVNLGDDEGTERGDAGGTADKGKFDHASAEATGDEHDYISN